MNICCLGLAWVPEGCLELARVLCVTQLFTRCLQSILGFLFHTSLMTILETAVLLIRLYRRDPERSSDLCKATQPDRARPLALRFRHCLELFPESRRPLLLPPSLLRFLSFFFLPMPFFCYLAHPAPPLIHVPYSLAQGYPNTGWPSPEGQGRTV